MPNIEHYETELLGYATERLLAVPGLEIVGTAAHKASVLSFVIDGIEPTAIGMALNQEGIAVRAGHHCAQPILRRFGHEATVRASLAFYNTCAEIDAMSAVLRRLTASSTGRRVGPGKL
jgi:cysteine desulfurase/selenocysteine lyase